MTFFLNYRKILSKSFCFSEKKQAVDKYIPQQLDMLPPDPQKVCKIIYFVCEENCLNGVARSKDILSLVLSRKLASANWSCFQKCKDFGDPQRPNENPQPIPTSMEDWMVVVSIPPKASQASFGHLVHVPSNHQQSL